MAACMHLNILSGHNVKDIGKGTLKLLKVWNTSECGGFGEAQRWTDDGRARSRHCPGHAPEPALTLPASVQAHLNLGDGLGKHPNSGKTKRYVVGPAPTAMCGPSRGRRIV